MSCPWAKIDKPEPMNLQEIMSEEVAKDLQAKEEKKYMKNMKLDESVVEAIQQQGNLIL